MSAEAEGHLLDNELRRIYGDRSCSMKWFLPFSRVEEALAFLQRVPTNSGDMGIHQALATHSTTEAERLTFPGQLDS